jgi:ATP-binding cassette subfamily C (CFTR/MRP) protein 4
MQLRIGSVAAVFSKALRLNSVGGDVSPGQVMNLVSNDVERFLVTTLFISYLFWAPAQALLILFVGIYLIGYSFAAGFLLLLIFFVPLQFYLSKKFGILRSRVRETDSIGQALYVITNKLNILIFVL